MNALNRRGRSRPQTTHEPGQYSVFFGDEAIKVISIPTVAAAYNHEMNHVDRGDQLRSYTGYDHPLRRGPWQALTWTFLLEVILVNTYLLQLHSPQLNWPRFKNQTQWREHIYNSLFNTYGQESRARKRYRSRDESDLNNPQKRREHLNRTINHVNRHVKSDCLACQGIQLGQPRSRGQKITALQEVDGNKRRHRGRQTVYGCKRCNVAICNSPDCWYLYHRPIC
jgi:hypothetical protein